MTWNCILHSPVGLNIFSVESTIWPSIYSQFDQVYIHAKFYFILAFVRSVWCTWNILPFSPSSPIHSSLFLPSFQTSMYPVGLNIDATFSRMFTFTPFHKHFITSCNFATLYIYKNISPSVPVCFPYLALMSYVYLVILNHSGYSRYS